MRFNGDLEHWVKFFLVAVADTARNSCETLQKIIELRKGIQRKIIENGKRVQNSIKVVNAMYSRPIMSVSEIASKIDVSYQAANEIVKDLVKLNVIEEITGAQRSKNYAFKEYLELFK